ncbi:2-amino-4-hydroxy-6-hydroxymethyldihydropteridine diphosphokinase [Pontibacter oryzae]|uniref:2-amino-4-hydroxy-6-hydroxymethyldihydropteridine pyrophosphokinase n=1 Tax=Pontibacter oryzae TaxID=2304593 RepID=A0A399SHP8_9BACT|nr:2-amino-4-hydroxy-6-hydroxymethyldihydropteridine diphosphokinase [Pontibacter oryzae]RIJ42551.1 2-amino-4-hydroxy-6-hydroxymethyldihydropteridine diphosphokinase [Pontibacter oryzae]
MPKVYLLLGGNLGDRLAYLQQANHQINTHVGRVARQSKVYQTAAWGKTDQPNFLNQVLEVQTELRPELVLQRVNSIEQELGRKRLEHWGARVIDIDILFYDDLVMQTQRLSVPHPQLHLRRFTLLPLSELAPDMEHPILQQSIKLLLEQCPDVLDVQVFEG